ncbi:MAG: SDR family NAD(P)-dependent oxidoreductase, partial [Planctomycetota bacterium]
MAQAPVVALPAAPALDLNALMLEVVADKTGYPAEMLNAGMDLEGDLGIDSIKRVEILAAVQKQAPGMPDVDAGHMGTLRTLAEIVEYMQSLMPASAAHGSAAATGNIGPAIDLHALMLEVVAEKTGYPAEMLSAEMDLEGDLGIDSIKRVEILAAVQKQAPGMPDVDAGHMGTLRTLAEIIGYMQGLMPSAGASGASSAAALTTPAAAAPAPIIDLNALMLEVVAEKTGYPADMLSPEMELEGDLGIDSIKRVEILAAVQKRAPGMPDVDAGHMGTLQTLAQIVDYMQSLLAEAVGVVPSETTDVVPSETTGVASPASAAPTQAPANAVTTASPQAPALGRFDLRVVSAPATGLAQPGLLGGHPVYVTADGTDLNHRLAVLLQERGVAAHAVDAVPAGAHAAIFLGGLRSLGSEADAIAINREAFAAARTLAPTLTTEAGLFVTVQDTGGSFCLSGASRERALLSGLPALTKTALQEWPKASLKSIDIEVSGRDTEAIARCLRDELLLGGGEIEVGLNADGSRHTLQSVEVAVQRGAARIGAGDVVVVSGGARGVTAACVIEWAKESRARFVLLGRTPLSEEPTCCAGDDSDADLKRALLDQARAAGQLPTPAELGAKVRRILGGREIRSTLAAINAAGAEARYEAVSVTDAAKLSTTLDVIRKEWGPITGLVHGAGVLADKVIAEKTDEQFDRVFDTKIVGIQCLLAATKGDALKVLCMFSSVSARCGNNGQSDYAMANEILGKLAHTEARARGESCLVKSLAWGPWEGGMVTPQLKARFAELGVPMIPLQVGARMFTDELCSAQTAEIELVLGGEPKAEALLFEGTDERWFEMQVRVDRTSHEYLAGHSIAEAPVVPVVLALEWFARHARSLRPGLQLTAIRNVQVIKGIELAGFDTAGDLFSVRSLAQPSHAGAAFAMELRGQGGTLHYRASAELSSEAPTSTEAVPQPALADWPHPLIYGDVLFHEGPFQVIESMDGVSDDAIGATLRGILEAGWREASWCLDVAALDGGLQLAILLG